MKRGTLFLVTYILAVLTLAVIVGLTSCTPTRAGASDPNVYTEHGLMVHKMDSGDICYVVEGGDYGNGRAISCVKH